MHTSAQAPKGNKAGVCVEVGIGSITRASAARP